MSRFVVFVVIVLSMALSACSLFGDSEESSTTGTEVNTTPVASETPVAPETPDPAVPETPAAPATETPPAPAVDGAEVCARASRCCSAAFATPGLPPMYADRREQACGAVEGSTNADLCTTAIGGWRQMVSGMPGATMPADCSE